MTLTKLQKRIAKADKLVWVDTPGVSTTTGGTWGSRGDRYKVSIFSKKETIQIEIDTQTIETKVISVQCDMLAVDNGKLNPMINCVGNCQHTVCYHSLSYLKHKLLKRGKQIYYFENLLTALNGLNFGGQLTKVVSKQGEGYVWTVIRDKPKILSSKENITLMRGNKEDEGID